MATTAEVPEDDEAWLYGEADKKDEKPDDEPAGSTLSADAPPFEPATGASKMEDDGGEDKEAGEVSGEDAENQDDDDEDSDEDDVQVTIGDIKTQPTTYEKFKSGYTRSGQAKQSTTKGVDLETPGLINDASVYEYDLNILNVDDRPWRKPGADITDYFNYGFTEDTWMKYCEKQKYLRQENGVGKIYDLDLDVHSVPSVNRAPAPITKTTDPPPQSPTYRSAPTPTPTTPPTTGAAATAAAAAAATLDQNALLRLGAGPPPGRKMSGAIDVIGGTRNDSRRPKNQYEYENQNPNDTSTDYTKKWPPTHGPPPDLPPPHIPPPGYGPPPPMSVPPPGPVPPPHMGGPPMGVPPPSGPPPRFSPGGPPQPNYRDGYYPPPSGPPPVDRGPPPGYDNRGPYGGYDNYGAPPPGYGAPPPAQPGWDNRGAPPFNDWEYRRDRSPARSESEFSSSGEEYGDRRYRGRDMYDPFERDLNYERSRQGRPRSRERDREREARGGGERERGDREDRSRDRERRHRDRGDRERPDREKEERHRRSSSRKEVPEGEHRSSKHKKSKRSKRDREDEAMDTSQPAATGSS